MQIVVNANSVEFEVGGGGKEISLLPPPCVSSTELLEGGMRKKEKNWFKDGWKYGWEG